MEGHGKSKSAGKKKKENKKKEEETEKKQEGEAVVKEVEDEKESAEKKKKREDQSVRLFHDDTFKGRSLEIFWPDPWMKQCRFLPKAVLE